jgi:TP901 family phage tail tape measure protein
MGSVIEEIGGRWGDMTREQQISLAQTMAGQRQYSNLIALFDNFGQYNEALKTAQEAEGTLQAQQDIYMESTRAHIEQLTASAENLFDSLIDTDSIEEVTDVLSDMANGAALFVDSIGGGIGVLRVLGSVGLTVFSNQIANGLVTTINNLQKAKEQAEYFKNAIQ